MSPSRAVVTDATRRLSRFAGGAMLDGVVDEVGERLAEQFAARLDHDRFRRLDHQLDTGLVSHRFVEVGHVADDGAGVDLGHGAVRRARLDARDHQERVERLDELVRFLDRGLQRGAVARRVIGAGERGLDAVAEARQRRLQVVGDVVGDVLDAVEQMLDALEHGVQAVGQPVEFVAGAGHLEPSGQVAEHDPAAGRGQRIDALQHAAADEDVAQQRQPDHQRQRPGERLADDLAELLALADVAADQHAEPAGQAHDLHQRGAPPRVARRSALIGDGDGVDAGSGRGDRWRPR